MNDRRRYAPNRSRMIFMLSTTSERSGENAAKNKPITIPPFKISFILYQQKMADSFYILQKKEEPPQRNTIATILLRKGKSIQDR